MRRETPLALDALRGGGGRGAAGAAERAARDLGEDQPPQPHAILAQLKAGETVYQAGELPKTLRVSKIHYEPPKTVRKTLLASIFPPSMHPTKP